MKQLRLKRKQILKVKNKRELIFTKGEKFKIKCVIDNEGIQKDVEVLGKIIIHVDKIFSKNNIRWFFNIKKGSLPLEIIAEFIANVTWEVGKIAIQEVVDYLNSDLDEKSDGVKSVETSHQLKDKQLHEELSRQGINEFFIEDVHESKDVIGKKSYIGYDTSTMKRYTVIVENNLVSEIFESKKHLKN